MSNAPTLTLETHLILPFQLEWQGRKPAATGSRAPAATTSMCAG